MLECIFINAISIYIFVHWWTYNTQVGAGYTVATGEYQAEALSKK